METDAYVLLPDTVIPAQAGIQRVSTVCVSAFLDPRFREDDGYAYSFETVGVVA